MAESTVQVEIDIQVLEALKSVAKIQKSVEDFAKRSEQNVTKLDATFASFAGNLAANVVAKGFSLVSDGIKAVANNIGEFVDASKAQEAATNSLNLALAQTGQFTKNSEENFEKWSDRLQKTTGIADEVIIANAAILQSITKLDEQGLRKASEAAIQFSSRFNVDLDTAFRNVGKAIEGNEGALKKWGVTIEKGANDAERLQNVLAALAPFAGSAEAKFKTFEGASIGLGVGIDELYESLGNIITRSPALTGAMNGAAQLFFQLAETVKENQAVITQYIDLGINLLIGSLSLVTGSFNLLLPLVQRADAYFTASKIIVAEITGAFYGAAAAISTFNEFLLDQLNASDRAIENQKRFTASLRAQAAEADKHSEVLRQNSIVRQKDMDAMVNSIGAAEKKVTETLKKSIEEQKSVTKEQRNTELSALNEHTQKKTEIAKHEFDLLNLLQESKKLQEADKRKEDLIVRQFQSDEDFQYLIDNLGKEEAMREIFRAESLANEDKKGRALQTLRDARSKAEMNDIMRVRKFEELSNKDKIANFKSTLGQIQTLQQSGNKTLFQVGKAAAIASILVDGQQAIVKALASAPPPVSFALAALTGAAVAAAVAKAASVEFQPGGPFAGGGIVGGSSVAGDQQLARVNSKEMILNHRQQANLFNRLDQNELGGEENNTGLISAILNQPIVLQIDGREIARATRNASLRGFAIA